MIPGPVGNLLLAMIFLTVFAAGLISSRRRAGWQRPDTWRKQ